MLANGESILESYHRIKNQATGSKGKAQANGLRRLIAIIHMETFLKFSIQIVLPYFKSVHQLIL